MAGGRSTGVVVRFSDPKGYGFIKPDDGGEDLFVHQSEIQSNGFRSLWEGQKVEFVIVEKNDRKQAVEVTGPDGSAVDRNRGRFGHLARDCTRGRGGGGGGGGGCYKLRRARALSEGLYQRWRWRWPLRPLVGLEISKFQLPNASLDDCIN